MDNQWEYDYSNLYSGSNGNAGANGSNGSNGNAGAQRPGDTSTYSTDASCGYTPQGSASAGGPADGQPPRPKKPVNGKKILTGALCLVLAGAVGFGGGYLGAIAAGGGNRVVYQTVQRDASSGDTTGSAASTLSLTDVSNIVSPSVVAITTEVMTSSNTWFGGQYVESGAGSGVIMSEDGYIITNNHVVEGGSAYEVMVAGETYEADLVGTDPSSDVAVLKAKDASGLTVMELGDSDNLTIGEWVMTLGSPFGLEQSVATGIVSATSRSQIMSAQESMQSGGTGEVTIYPNMIQTDAAINPGNSGGALVDDEGKLIGINTLITSYSGNYSGVGFAIPVNYAINLAQQIIAGETPTHAQLGVSLSTVSAATASRYGLPVDTGAYVAAVTPDSGAAAAGIVPGDIVTAFDGQAVESASDLMLDVRTKNPGDTVTLTVNSGGQEKEVQVTLGDDSASQKAKQEQQSQEQSMNGYSLEDLFGRQR